MKNFVFIPALIILLTLTSCVNETYSDDPFEFRDDTVIITVEDIDITYDLYRFYFLSLKDNYDTDDESSEKMLIAQCDEACLYYASMFVYAESKNVSLDDSDFKQIDKEIEGYLSFYGEDGYDEMLDSLNHSRNSYRSILKRQRLTEKCIKDLGVSSEELEEIINELMFHLKYTKSKAYWHISFENVI